ncbi:uncharacterized protein DNG_02469 [Cephalotrichum gorgonifer]|uniref:N-acetyltransferase domain-containing protein n=1 Tax=Cephalotrichum gorgonifer TaxID=2041049 RepID=A0AAE8MSG3_9PEZI|nr:uncharacterized protein DNG_02469 [Cephalotrichum gorgonifer]
MSSSNPPALSTRLFTESETHLIPYLAAIHANCITSDHTIVTFLPPLDQDRLLGFWKDRIAEVRDGRRFMILLFDESQRRTADAATFQSSSPAVTAPTPGNPGPAAAGRALDGPSLVGVVMLSTPYSETGPFRGWVEKLLVSPRFRRRGGARALMGALEEEAARRGRTLLMADTESGTVAEEMYKRLGYEEVGKIPNYGLSPAGGLRSETFFYKQLS